MLVELFTPRKPKARVARGSIADPPSWLVKLLGGGETASGVAVNEDSATTIAAVFNAVTVLSNPFKVLPFGMYRRMGPQAKEPAPDHPVHNLLHGRPNPEMPASRFWSYLQACKLLWGNGYAEIERNRRGVPIALWPIHPSRVRPGRNQDTGEIAYEIDGGKVVINRSNMLHILGFSRDGIMGISVVGEARESLGLTVAAENYGAQFFGNGSEPAGYLKRPADAPELDEEGRQNLRSTWYQQHGGQKRHSIAVLEEGTEFSAIGIPNEDAQFLETRKFQVTEVARWFNTPPHKLKDLERATYSNIEHAEIDFNKNSVAPHLVDTQDECNLKLLTVDENAQYYCEFNTAGDLWADHAARAAFYKELWGLGVLTINEIRARENLNPIGPAGDLHFVQLNMTTAEAMARTAGQPPKAELSPEQAAAAATLDFKRKAWLGFQADGTVCDVMANLNDLKQLNKDVGLRDNPEYVDPLLPVTTDSGPLVSGEVVKDSEGDAIGAGVMKAGTQGQRDGGTEGEGEAKDDSAEQPAEQPGDGQGESADQDGDGKAAAEGQQTRVMEAGHAGGDGTAGAQTVKAAMMPMFTAIAERVHRKEAAALERARAKYAGDSEAFKAWAAKFYGRLDAEIHDEFQPAALSLANALGLGGTLAAGERLARVAYRMAQDALGRALVAFERGGDRELCALDLAAENVMGAVVGADDRSGS